MAYAMFYVVRNNFAPVSKEIGAALHYDKAMIGDILAGTAIAYGIGKFVMGYFADRSDARKYVAVGMLLTAALNFLFGATTNYAPTSCSGRSTVSCKAWATAPARADSRIGTARRSAARSSASGTSRTISAAASPAISPRNALHIWGWPSAFYVPGIIATLGAVYLFWRMRDTPQSRRPAAGGGIQERLAARGAGSARAGT